MALLLPAAAAVAVLLAGCSSDLVFPAVHDMPPARSDTTLTPDQVKNATDALVTEREHLSTAAQATQAEAAQATQPTGTVPASSAVTKAKAKKKKPETKPTTAQAAPQPAAAAATQTAGVDVKPQ